MGGTANIHGDFALHASLSERLLWTLANRLLAQTQALRSSQRRWRQSHKLARVLHAAQVPRTWCRWPVHSGTGQGNWVWGNYLFHINHHQAGFVWGNTWPYLSRLHTWEMAWEKGSRSLALLAHPARTRRDAHSPCAPAHKSRGQVQPRRPINSHIWCLIIPCSTLKAKPKVCEVVRQGSSWLHFSW